jgi:mandelamide amidase
MWPAIAALSRPGRRSSLRLIVKVSRLTGLGLDDTLLRAVPGEGLRPERPDKEPAMRAHFDATRRQFLKGLAMTGAVAGTGGLTGPGWGPIAAEAGPAGRDELLALTAIEAVAAMVAGDLRAETYAGVLLGRAHSLQYLNVLISQQPDQVLAAARAADRARASGRVLGPLHGLPLLIKDNVNSRALATTGGTPGLAGNRPGANARVLERMLGAGGLLFGKANMHELAFGITSNNAAFGPVRNPYDPRMIPGGSSGGNAAGVAARFVPAGIGSDTGGSTRIPAALCGIAGYRPTAGRYPSTGQPTTQVIPISHTRDTTGPMARTVADVALMDAVITGAPPALAPASLAGLRLGVLTNFLADLDPEVERLFREAVRRLADRGALIVDVSIPDLTTINDAVGFPLALFEARTDLPVYLDANGTGLTLEALTAQIASPDVRGIFEQFIIGPGAVPEAVYLNALLVERPRLQAAYQQAFEGAGPEALLFPTTPLPARPIGQDSTVELNGRQVPTFFTFIRHTDPDSNAGLPGLSVPIGLTRDGLPVGLELDGQAGSDRHLLAIGLAVEQEFGTLPRPRPERMRGLRS